MGKDWVDEFVIRVVCDRVKMVEINVWNFTVEEEK